MPGKSKYVRFSRTTAVHAQATPQTPALSLGSLSPTSSSGLLTPPRPFAMGLPGPSPYGVPYAAKSQARPHMGGRPVRPHPVLQFSHSPVLKFDVTQPPSTISTHHRGVSLRILSEPATDPPLPNLTIISPLLPWATNIAAPRGAFVTVGDVLHGLYRSLRINISSQDFHSLQSKDRIRVTTAYEQRCKCVRGTREYEHERRGGVRRVDFLMGHTQFTGLSSTNRGPGYWVLNTS